MGKQSQGKGQEEKSAAVLGAGQGGLPLVMGVATSSAAKGVLREGDRGEDVLRVCTQLRALGYWDAAVIDAFTPKMTSVVRWFQVTNLNAAGRILKDDGEVGDQTRWALQHSRAEMMRQRLFAVVPGSLSTIRQDMVRAALADHARGTREMPDGANCGDGVERFLHGGPPIPWCMAAVSEWWRDASGSFPFGHRYIGVEAFWEVARRNGVGFTRKNWLPAPGDLAVWQFGRGQGHIAVICAVDSNPALFTSCGGNESNSVRLRNRCLSDEKSIVGFVRLAGDTGAGHEKGLMQCSQNGASMPLLADSSR